MIAQQNQWVSYDSVAAIYAKIAVPMVFDKPARDLVKLLKVKPQDQILDVGAGTGAATKWLQKAVVPSLFAVDLSAPMLKRNPAPRKVIGSCEKLPFQDRTFDVVLAGFILNHVSDFTVALNQMVQMLRKGGRLGTSTWENRRNEYADAWTEIAETYGGKEFFREVQQKALKWEEWFTDPGHVKAALTQAGLGKVRVKRRRYTVMTKIEEDLLTRATSLQGRFLRQKIGDQEWSRFKATVGQQFRKRFHEPLQFTTVVLFGLGNKLS